MLNIGEQIVHPRYGAGTVMETRDVTYNGETREYICIELVGDRGTVMVQADFLDEVDFRTEITSIDLIKKIMTNTPSELSKDHRTRQTNLKKKIDSGMPRQIIQALRDLCWREHQRDNGLSDSDTKLRKRAHRLIAQELALKPTRDLTSAAYALDKIILNAMKEHQEAVAAV